MAQFVIALVLVASLFFVLFVRKSNSGQRRGCNRRNPLETPPRKWWSRILGRMLGEVFSRVSSAKWQYLGRFLLGKGGSVILNQQLVDKGMANLSPASHVRIDGQWFIRPEASEELFWMVGGMTLEEKSPGVWEGEDVYDFHPQYGQGVQAQRSSKLCWSFSSLSPWLSVAVGLVRRFFPDSLIRAAGKSNHLVYRQMSLIAKRVEKKPVVGQFLARLIKEVAKTSAFNESWEVSNDLWNWFGGVPFTSVVKWQGNPELPMVDAKYLFDSWFASSESQGAQAMVWTLWKMGWVKEPMTQQGLLDASEVEAILANYPKSILRALSLIIRERAEKSRIKVSSETITLWRGRGEVGAYRRPIESWTDDRETAVYFAGEDGEVLRKTFRRDRILSCYKVGISKGTVEWQFRDQHEYIMLVD